MNLAEIEAYLTTKYIGKASVANELWDEIGSTNDRAIELAQQGCPQGVMVLSRSQTKGRGRQSRNWLSPPDCGIYFSVILRPPTSEIARASLPLYTLACGTACVEALVQQCSVPVGLKWVNDLILNEKKLGGILAEMPSPVVAPEAGLDQSVDPAIILGMGINVRKCDDGMIPAELKDKIIFLDEVSDAEIDECALVASLAQYLEYNGDLLLRGRHSELLDKWRRHSVTLGKSIRTSVNGNEIVGQAIDITETGALIIQCAGGEMVTLPAGEISIRTADGGYL